MIVGMNEAPIQTERERLENGGISLLKYLMDDLIETSNTICKRVRFISHMKVLIYLAGQCTAASVSNSGSELSFCGHIRFRQNWET